MYLIVGIAIGILLLDPICISIINHHSYIFFNFNLRNLDILHQIKTTTYHLQFRKSYMISSGTIMKNAATDIFDPSMAHTNNTPLPQRVSFRGLYSQDGENHIDI